MRSSILLAAAVISTALLSPGRAQYPGALPVEDRVRPGFDSITVGFCKKVLAYLAGPECEGRRTGTEGYDKAAHYVAARFSEFGLKPVGDGETWFQNVPFLRFRVHSAGSFLALPCADLKLECGKDVSFDASVCDLEAEVVFVAAGPDSRLEDPSVMRDRVVILSLPEAKGGRRARRRRGAVGRQMFQNRPRAVLRVAGKVAEMTWRTRLPRSRRSRSTRARGVITVAAARRLARALGVDVAMAGRGGTGDVATAVVAGGRKARLVVKVETEDRPVPNVVGLIEGSDPQLKDEVVICGAHLDHLGKRSDGSICYGADDDGSGSTALVALARALSRNPVRPRRSILLLAFCAEEMGLVGSRHYTNHPIVPLERTVCELQMDMIGRNEESSPRGRRPGEKAEENVDTINLVGSRRLSKELHEMVLAANRFVNLRFEYDEERVYGGSDHVNFARKGIPVVFFFSGFHPDYHRPTDTVDRINFEKLVSTARLVYLLAFAVADRQRPLKVDRGPFRTG